MGRIGGEAVITTPEDQSDVDFYSLHFLSSAGAGGCRGAWVSWVAGCRGGGVRRKGAGGLGRACGWGAAVGLPV